ncbi:MAG: hypothetical protein RL007_1588 [Bacteroidota bacterium]|jgi:hypothetical protein
MANEKHFGENLADILRKAAVGLEKYQVQLALGEMEAKDHFEKLKKKFKSSLNTAQQYVENNGRKAKDEVLQVIDEMKVQLALGKAESLDEFEVQEKKIMRAFRTLEARIDGVIDHEAEEELHHDMQQFRIKLDMLKVQYKLGNMEARDKFEERKHELEASMSKLKAKIESKRKLNVKTRAARKEEIKESYKHLKKAFTVKAK